MLLTWSIGRAINNVSKRKMGSNSALKGLSTACYALDSPCMSQKTLKMVFDSYFLSIMKYINILLQDFSVKFCRIEKNMIKNYGPCKYSSILKNSKCYLFNPNIYLHFSYVWS